jgi:endonuclease YncB( thermonuclease family)
MPATALAPVPKTYAELRRAVELTLFKGQQAVELARVRTYHETGRLIHEHVLLFKERADYGAGTIQRLAADLKTHRSQLQRCVQFYQEVPNCAARRNLTWTHYRLLLPIADAKVRNALAREADRKGWTGVQLEQRIRALAPAEEAKVVEPSTGEPPVLLTPQRGTPGLHRIVARGDGLAVDLGFKLYWPLTPEQTKRLAKGDIVRIADDDSLRLVEGATKAELFTYAATLRRVVDGDTLVVELEVSPGVFIEQKLRLRGLDCPELNTPEGRAAKRFVDALVAKSTAVVINTTKPDKFDRYLADVFLRSTVSDKLKAESLEPEAEIFLNNALLENGHAVRKDASDFGDNWDRI